VGIVILQYLSGHLLILLICEKFKMKRFTLLLGFVTITSLSVNAQINQTPVHSNGNQIYTYGEEKLETQGSAYYLDKYMPAKMTGSDEIILLRYNAYLDQFELNNPQTQTEMVLPKDAGKDIVFSGSGDTYSYIQYKNDKDEVVNGYLKVVSNTPVKIYKTERIFLQQGKPTKNSYQSAKPPVLKHADVDFYILLPGSTQASFFDGKKDFAKLIPGKEKEVLEYIKTNKLDLDKDADLQKLSAYVETVL
jgi:hypothetical protein